MSALVAEPEVAIEGPIETVALFLRLLEAARSGDPAGLAAAALAIQSSGEHELTLRGDPDALRRLHALVDPEPRAHAAQEI